MTAVDLVLECVWKVAREVLSTLSLEPHTETNAMPTIGTLLNVLVSIHVWFGFTLVLISVLCLGKQQIQVTMSEDRRPYIDPSKYLRNTFSEIITDCNRGHFRGRKPAKTIIFSWDTFLGRP